MGQQQQGQPLDQFQGFGVGGSQKHGFGQGGFMGQQQQQGQPLDQFRGFGVGAMQMQNNMVAPVAASMVQQGSAFPTSILTAPVGSMPPQAATPSNIFTAPPGSVQAHFGSVPPTGILTAPVGSAQPQPTIDHTMMMMLPTNQDLPTELFTIKAEPTTVDDPYASKDSLKLWERLKVSYGESLVSTLQYFMYSR